MQINIETIKQEIATLEPEADRLWQEHRAVKKSYDETQDRWLVKFNRISSLRKLIEFAEEEAKKTATAPTGELGL